MIEERDLDAAVTAGVLDAATRERLVTFTRDLRRGAAGPDDEQFRLLTGFNDIFVTIAIGLLLFAVGAIGGGLSPVVGAAGVAAASWGLAEYFTRMRRMALPSITLLLAFVLAIFVCGLVLFTGGTSFNNASGGSPGIVAAAAVAAGAAWLHWRRFMVPITAAAGAGALVMMAVAVTGVASHTQTAMLLTLLGSGLAVFALAMWFDTRDRARVTRRTDVAFWLHLLAAPLIVHPVFTLAGLTQSDAGGGAALIVILAYCALTIVALAIDRRALLVSALFYVIYAIQHLVGQGDLSASFGVTALVIGLFLVLLSAAWRPIRARVLALLPGGVAARLPASAV